MAGKRLRFLDIDSEDGRGVGRRIEYTINPARRKRLRHSAGYFEDTQEWKRAVYLAGRSIMPTALALSALLESALRYLRG
jgi:hypothetical protein